MTSTAWHALRALRASLPEPGLAGLVADGLGEAERTPWPARERALDGVASALGSAGIPVDRSAGDHYADRRFWHEERSSPFSERVRLGRPVIARLAAAVEAVLEPLYLAALLARADARCAVRDRLRGERVPLAAAATMEFPAATSRRDRLQEALGDLARRRGPAPDGVVRLTAADVAAACAPFWAQLTDRDIAPSAALPGVDLLADGPDPATATWVIGEVHDDSSSVLGGSSARVHSDPEALYGRFVDEVRALLGATPMAGVLGRRRTMHITPELPGIALELSGSSAKPHHEVRPVSAAVVAPDGDAVEVDGQRYRLYPGDLPGVLHRALSLPAVVPVDWGAAAGHTPRVTVDGVVVSRERWRVEPVVAGRRGYAHWSAVQALRRAHGLPRHVFVRHPAETKPLHVDLDEPMAVADIARLGPGRCEISECLPAPDRLWWAPGGQAQVCELRLPCLVDLRRQP